MPSRTNPQPAEITRPTPTLIAFTIAATVALEYLIDFPLLRGVIAAMTFFIVLGESHYFGIWRAQDVPTAHQMPSLARIIAPVIPMLALIAVGAMIAIKPPSVLRALATVSAALSLALVSYAYGRWLAINLPATDANQQTHPVSGNPITNNGE